MLKRQETALLLYRNCRESKFGLVIADWNMEPMTGLQLLKDIRADAKLITIPFIAESKTENVIATKQAGVNNYDLSIYC